MKRYVFILLVCLLTSCGIFRNIGLYKQTETVSQNTYAVRDSLYNGRYDLAESYIKELTKLVVIPSKFIELDPIIDKDGKQVVMLPDRFNNQKIILVGSDEHKKLLTIQEIAKQLANDNAVLISNTIAVDNAVKEQTEALDSLIYERDKYKKETEIQDENISKKNITIFFLVLLIGLYLYMKSGLKIPFI